MMTLGVSEKTPETNGEPGESVKPATEQILTQRVGHTASVTSRQRNPHQQYPARRRFIELSPCRVDTQASGVPYAADVLKGNQGG